MRKLNNPDKIEAAGNVQLSEGKWLDNLLDAYRADEQAGAHQTRGALARADTAQRVAALADGVDLLHEGLDEHAAGSGFRGLLGSLFCR